MYEALVLALDALGTPRDEIERTLLSAADLSATNADSQMHVAAFLARWGSPRRALALFRQASRIDPTRPEPYVVGFYLASQQRDLDAIQWTTLGILGNVWRGQDEQLVRRARGAVEDAIEQLRSQGRSHEAERFAEAVAEAERRDLMIRATWDGDADVDLIVEEPAGTVCSFRNPHTPAGGVLVSDGFGDRREELYVCSKAMPGRYGVRLRRVWGNLVGSRVNVKITRHEGSAEPVVEHQTVTVGDQDESVVVNLLQGRRTELLEGDFGEAGWLGAEKRSRDLARRRVRSLPTLNAAAVGFQPIIVPFPDGAFLSARAVISADRRYVRIGATPIFTQILGFTTVTQSAGVVGGGVF